MCYHLKNRNGNTQAIIDDNCGISKFYAIANALNKQLQVIFLNQVDDSENLDWDFNYKNQLLTLHYSTFEGVSISPRHLDKSVIKENNAVLEVSQFLERNAY
jgi:hypothetical protein